MSKKLPKIIYIRIFIYIRTGKAKQLNRRQNTIKTLNAVPKKIRLLTGKLQLD